MGSSRRVVCIRHRVSATDGQLLVLPLQGVLRPAGVGEGALSGAAGLGAEAMPEAPAPAERCRALGYRLSGAHGQFRGVPECSACSDVDGVKQIRCAAPEVLCERDARGASLLTLACKLATGDVALPPVRGTAEQHAVIDLLLTLGANGADPNLRHDFGGSEQGKDAVALHLAAQYGSLGCLRLLIARGADPTIADAAFDSTPLGWALHVGAVESAEILRAAGA